MGNKHTIGEAIRYYRSIKNLSQEGLALKAELNPAFLGHLERGEKSPTVKTLEKIANALDITLTELFSYMDLRMTENELEQALLKINLVVKDLNSEEINDLTKIIKDIIRFKAKLLSHPTKAKYYESEV